MTTREAHIRALLTKAGIPEAAITTMLPGGREGSIRLRTGCTRSATGEQALFDVIFGSEAKARRVADLLAEEGYTVTSFYDMMTQPGLSIWPKSGGPGPLPPEGLPFTLHAPRSREKA